MCAHVSLSKGMRSQVEHLSPLVSKNVLATKLPNFTVSYSPYFCSTVQAISVNHTTTIEPLK